MTTHNTVITQAFCDAWMAKDLDAIMDFFTEDAIYTNMPMDPPNCGKVEIRLFIEGFMGMAAEIEFIIHHQVEGVDGVVMNERTDRFKINDKWIDIQVMGVFEFSKGKSHI